MAEEKSTWDKIKEEALGQTGDQPLNSDMDESSNESMQEELSSEQGFREHIGDTQPIIEAPASSELTEDTDAEYGSSHYEAGDEAFLDRDSQ